MKWLPNSRDKEKAENIDRILVEIIEEHGICDKQCCAVPHEEIEESGDYLKE